MTPVADAPVDVRAQFLVKTYTTLLTAVVACCALTTAFMTTPGIRDAILGVLNVRFGGLIMMVGFMGVTWLASSWAHSSPSAGTQYAGLSLSVLAHAVLFTLLLTVAERVKPGVSPVAGVLTIAIFATLTAVVYYTRMNFSFLGPILGAAAIAALVLVVANSFMRVDLGIWFAGAMIVLACGYILYDTSRILHDYPPHAHVGAALELFGSVAMLFWYIVRLLMQLRDGGE
jgi:hypothetical protein